jgi:cellulose synthase/poly-beta-1,6-N-acetylglucosamine synthase-like glycosyltransferase
MKSRYGFQCLLGHGAMISRACYQAVGGFPHIVAEDIGFTLLARKAGYKIVFAPNIICGEEFPVDYLAFRKRQSKWTLGNLEFTKKFLISSIASNKFNLTWCEKLDLLFGPFALIFSTIGIGLLIIAEIVFRFLEFKFDGIFDYFFIIPSTIFVISPMIMDITTWYKLTWYRYLTYIFASIVLYSGIIFVSAYYIILGLCGKKPKFVVTPKEEYNTYFKVAIKSYLPDIIFWQ